MQITDLQALDAMPVYAWAKNPEGKYVWVNRALREHFDNEELVGKTDLELMPPELAESYRERDKEVLESGKPGYFHEPLKSPGHEQEETTVCKFVDELNGEKCVFGIGMPTH